MRYVIGKDGRCVGHVIKRRRQFEAFNRDDKSLGCFQSEIDAVKMIFAREDFDDGRRVERGI